jgi:hypothetical protein
MVVAVAGILVAGILVAGILVVVDGAIKAFRVRGRSRSATR